jgi:hypothetical protein
VPKHLTSSDASDFITSAVIGQTNGVAQLGPDGKVPDSQLPAVLTGSVDSVNGKIGNVSLTADDVGAVPLSQKGVANGVPQLDSTGRVPASQIPATVVQTSSLGAANGIATLGPDGKLASSQTPVAPVTSVNGKTGTVSLTSPDIGAIPNSQKAVANGVATLDDNTKVPLSQIPSLNSLYQPLPNTLPVRPGQLLSAVAGGSISIQWVDPLLYVASSLAAMPTSVTTGALCVRTDLLAIYEWTGSDWNAIVPTQQPWQTLPLPSGTRGYSSNNPDFTPQYRKIGDQVWIKGRIELTSGANFSSGYTINLPSQIVPTHLIDAAGTSTTTGGQPGICRWQIQPDGQMIFFAGSGPTPATPWLGFNITYMTD